MLQIVLLAGKFVFLIILYLFIYRVVRSTTRELRAAAPTQKDAGSWQPQQYAASEALPVPPIEGRPVDRPGGVWSLVVQKSPTLSPGNVYPFPTGARALVGRSSETDIQLDDTFVSSKHAVFESTAAGLQVEDLRSTNGTQVNGADVQEVRLLRHGDRVEVGDTVFHVEAL